MMKKCKVCMENEEPLYPIPHVGLLCLSCAEGFGELIKILHKVYGLKINGLKYPKEEKVNAVVNDEP
jgi:hypothetical protein